MDDFSDQSALIDRLATGDLDDVARRDLFAWLDGEPRRWRRCALALLETREIEHALGTWQSEASRPAPLFFRPPAPRSSRGAVFALAASVLVAFGLGIFARGFWIGDGRLVADAPAPRHDAGHDLAQTGSGTIASSDTPSSDKPSSDTPPNNLVKPSTSSPRQTAVVTEPPAAQPHDPIPSYIRGQWERRGFQITSRPAQLPVVLPDGRRTMAAVDELKFNYVGQRTY